MKYIVLGLAIAVGTVIGVKLDQGPSKSDTVENKAATVAEGMSAILPKDLGDGTILQRARAEGKTIVLEFSGMPSWEPELTSAEATKVLAVMACKQRGFDKMVNDGGSVRIEATSPSGVHLPSLLIDSCPNTQG